MGTLTFRWPKIPGASDLTFNRQPNGTGSAAGRVGVRSTLKGRQVHGATLAGTVQPRGALTGRQLHSATLAGALPIKAAASFTIDPNRLTGPGCVVSTAWQQGGPVRGRVRGDISQGADVRGTGRGAWADGTPLSEALRGAWGQLPAKRQSSRGGFGEAAQRLRSESTAAWVAQLPIVRGDSRPAWGEIPFLGMTAAGVWPCPPAVRGLAAAAWRQTAPAFFALTASFHHGPRHSQAWRLVFGRGHLLLPGRTPRPEPPGPPPPWLGHGRLTFIPGTVPPAWVVFDRRGFWSTIPPQRVYIVIHDISLSRDGTPVPCQSFTLALDADSWAWQFSARLLGPDALGMLAPSGDAPVILDADVNGYTWACIVDTWREEDAHGSRSINVSGRSLSAELGAPWQLPGSGVSTTLRLAQQLAGDQLPSGWTLTWDLVDWLIPAGAWVWDRMTPISAIQAIAAAAGGIVIPGRNARTLTVQARYPVLPWEFGAATPDLTIPAAAITGLSLSSTPDTQANAVYVHGGSVGGILARVLLDGSAGDRVAPTVHDALITHADAARGRGGRILAGQYRQPALRGFSMPIGTGFPLANLGALVLAEYQSEQYRGIVNAVTVTAGEGKARQSITMGEETPNTWARFRGLLPDRPLLVATIATVHGDGTATVTLPDGSPVRVRGTGTAGDAVYIRDGRIEGEAPSLPYSNIPI